LAQVFETSVNRAIDRNQDVLHDKIIRVP